MDKVADIDSKSKVLDVGCCLGHHVEYYIEKGVNVQGLDKSESMVKLAKKRYPKAKNVTKRYNLSKKYFKFLGKRTKKIEKERRKMKFKID